MEDEKKQTEKKLPKSYGPDYRREYYNKNKEKLRAYNRNYIMNKKIQERMDKINYDTNINSLNIVNNDLINLSVNLSDIIKNLEVYEMRFKDELKKLNYLKKEMKDLLLTISAITSTTTDNHNQSNT